MDVYRWIYFAEPKKPKQNIEDKEDDALPEKTSYKQSMESTDYTPRPL